MATRGRLIAPIMIGIRRLDRTNTVVDDPMRAPVVTRPLGERGSRKVGRVELPTEIKIRAQFEPLRENDMRQGPAGNVPEYDSTFILHFRDLEARGLVDATTGRAVFLPNDRVESLYDRQGKLVRTYDNPQLFIVKVEDRGIGQGGKRNLCLLRVADRQGHLTESPR